MADAGANRPPLVVRPGEGRRYAMGRMQAVFKADRAETAHGYSLSEWWLEPRTRLPGPHAHPEDHVFYVIEGTLNVLVGEEWVQAPRGSYVLIPGGTPHAFENREAAPAGFIAFTVPGGFEEDMPGIAAALGSEDLAI